MDIIPVAIMAFLYLFILIKVVHAVGWRIPSQNEKIISELQRLNSNIESKRP